MKKGIILAGVGARGKVWLEVLAGHFDREVAALVDINF